jgi:hypothetical protein
VVCDTRLESRIDSVRPLKYQAGEIHDALYYISQEVSYDPITEHEVELLAYHMRVLSSYAVLPFG